MTTRTREPTERARVAGFAQAMAKREFGRFYVSDRDLAEVRRSLDRKTRSAGPDRSGRPKPRT
jgi:hypothetical protein